MDSRFYCCRKTTIDRRRHTRQIAARQGLVGNYTNRRPSGGARSMTTQSFAEVLEACTQRCLQIDAPLAERLNALANDVRHLDPSFADVVDRMVNRLRQIEAGKSAPSVGDPMPLFVLPDETGRLVGLAQLLERGPVVMSFHRGHWCPYCRISADALARIEPEVRAASAEIVLITPEVQKFTSEFKADARASFAVL